MANINNLIIFGDSLSDIGNKRETITGQIARILGLMRTNGAGRFSDSKVWTDFIWEWSGGQSMFMTDAKTTRELTKPHRTLNKNSRQGTPETNQFTYANYAEGGAMGASDKSGVGLGTFKEQMKAFFKDAKKVDIEGQTNLFLIWFGLNDLVTNGRSKNDMSTVAREMGGLCRRILEQYPDSYFILANLPNPQTAVRYVDNRGTQKIVGYNDGALQFSVSLAEEAENIKVGKDTRASIVDIRTPTDDIDENAEKYGLVREAQPKGAKVRYDGEAAPKQYSTTSDKAHPTETVYKLMANIWAHEIVSFLKTKGQIQLGSLATSGEDQFIIPE